MSNENELKLMEAINELRSEVEKKNQDQNKEKIEKINADLDAQEKANQKLVAELKQAEKGAEELKERMAALEIELAHGKAGQGKNYKESEEYKALELFVKGGHEELARSDMDVKALLRTDIDKDGGYLVHSEIESTMLKNITETSPIRSAARVRTITSKSLEIPKRTGILTSSYEGEAETAQTSASTYGTETLTAYRHTVTVPITWDLLNDASFNMESEIMMDAAEAFAQKEGVLFVSGDGVKKPQGFLNAADSRVQFTETENSLDVTATDVIKMTGELKTGYNPVYMLNRQTLAYLRTLKSANGEFLWQPGMNGPVANTLNGYPYFSAIDMGAYNVAGDEPIAFGDFARGYLIVDRTGMSIIRDDYTKKNEATVEFNIKRWNFGKVVLPEAIRTLKVKA